MVAINRCNNVEQQGYSSFMTKLHERCYLCSVTKLFSLRHKYMHLIPVKLRVPQ